MQKCSSYFTICVAAIGELFTKSTLKHNGVKLITVTVKYTVPESAHSLFCLILLLLVYFCNVNNNTPHKGQQEVWIWSQHTEDHTTISPHKGQQEVWICSQHTEDNIEYFYLFI